jgi:hypothetical protein
MQMDAPTEAGARQTPQHFVTLQTKIQPRLPSESSNSGNHRRLRKSPLISPMPHPVTSTLAGNRHRNGESRFFRQQATATQSGETAARWNKQSGSSLTLPKGEARPVYFPLSSINSLFAARRIGATRRLLNFFRPESRAGAPV